MIRKGERLKEKEKENLEKKSVRDGRREEGKKSEKQVDGSMGR